MNFVELKMELRERGFDLPDHRLGQYINFACAELDDEQLWPYREKSATGTSPLSITDLGTIEAVIDLTNDRPLAHMDYQSLVDSYANVDESGDAEVFYVASPSAVPTVVAYPSNGNTIGVQYWRATTDLTSAEDEPAAPDRFHRIVLDLASRWAAMDLGKAELVDRFDLWAQRGIQSMTNALLVQQTSGPDAFQSITFASEDW